MGVRRRPPRRPWRRSIPAADGSVRFRSRGILAVEAGREAHSAVIVSSGCAFADGGGSVADTGRHRGRQRCSVADSALSPSSQFTVSDLAPADCACPHR